MSSGISSFFSSFFPVVHADSETSVKANEIHEAKDESEERIADKEEKEEEKGEEKEDEQEEKEEEEEEEEPEDLHPVIREECQQTAKCAPLVKHFEHCQDKVQSGKGFKGEDCVEELMMHCVDDCAGPKLFTKLR